MIAFLLFLILLAVLFSTANGRELLILAGWVAILPLTIPYKLVKKLYSLVKEYNDAWAAEYRQRAIQLFEQNFTAEDIELLDDSAFLTKHFDAVNEQLESYHEYQTGVYEPEMDSLDYELKYIKPKWREKLKTHLKAQGNLQLQEA